MAQISISSSVISSSGPQDISLTGNFAAGDTYMNELTIDSVLTAIYTTSLSDSGSGLIEYSINGGAYAVFSNPFKLISGDTLIVRRADATADGFFTISGFVSDRLISNVFGSGVDTSDTITINTDTQGTYYGLSDDGSSGTVTYSLNGAAYASFPSSVSLVSGDTISFKRMVTTTLGFVKIFGIQ